MEDNDGHGPVAKDDLDRVRAHTDPSIQEAIDRETEERVRRYATQPEGAVSRRIEELEREWDTERLLELNASALAFTGLALGATVGGKKWLWVPAVVLPFLLQHAVQGWCPPLALLRRLGVRTRREIDGEKFALKALRGDFDSVRSEADKTVRASAALRAVRAQ